ncbi:serine carboxypeptidase [Ancylostoma caninum]|uniref:Serine carboxypeptidase n=1 Tax=Ancylostoma caninum TaxID=29170 RepID=A0A368F2Q3_ANCCA|nr:serine carboxypeptidase [Ancylostoma caninum]
MLAPFLATLLFCASLGTAVHNTVNTWNGLLQYDEDWGYADIRTGAHTFWWLYAVKPANDRPLILWLQGGPGASSTGFGNFEETGPKRMNNTDNEATWLQVADMVYVDNPVGAGFSYVDEDGAFTKNVAEIGQDLLAWLRQFLVIHPEYRTRPFFIFCESYGGKMSAEFARVITQEISAGNLRLDFRGVALGDSWISAMDYVNSWGEFLYANSYLDNNQLARVNAQAKSCQKKVDQGQWKQATTCWGNMEDLIGAETGGVSWYNILKYGGQDDWSKKRRKRSAFSALNGLFNRHVGFYQKDALSNYMDTTVRDKLGIIPDSVKFGGAYLIQLGKFFMEFWGIWHKRSVAAQSNAVFNFQSEDFMKPNWDTVDALLKNGTNVIVYNGNQDLICDSVGESCPY